jgi:hypothetical protein
MKNHVALLLPLLSSPALAQAPLYDHSGGAPGDQMAAAVAALGDVNGDGAGDYAMGAPHADGLEPDAGCVYVRSGKDASVPWIFAGEHAGDLLGFSLAALGDIDGDGVSDLIAGAPLAYVGFGAVYVISGATGAQLWKFKGVGDPGQLGYAVAGVGDVNTDGVPDFAFGAPYRDNGWSPDDGYVEIRSGVNAAGIHQLVGEQSGSRFGFALDGAGDVDGDGRGELLVGAPGFDVGVLPFLVPETGKAYLVSGLNGSTLHSETGGFAFDTLGWSVAGGVDVNGDAVPDFGVGAPYADPAGANSGQVRIRSGAAPFPQLYALGGAAAGDELGYALDLALDADGDGLGDVLVGAPGIDFPTFADGGKAYVHNGSTGALRYEIGGRVAGDRMGMAVGTVGLVNGDAWTDYLTGAPLADHAVGVDAGWGRVHLGNAEPPVNYCTAKTNSAGCVPFISYGGCPSVSVGSFNIGAISVLPGKPGMLIWSFDQQAVPFYGGTLCLKNPIVRTPVQTSSSSPDPCGGVYNFAFTQAYMAAKGVAAGNDVYAQFWSRDSGFPPPNGIGLTNGLHVTVLP